MAVTIRLARHGQPHRPFYRIVTTDKEKPRDGKFLEVVGTYNPMVEPPAVKLVEDRIKYWIEVGARPSPIVGTLIKKNFPGLLEAKIDNKTAKVRAARKARKLRAAKV